MAWLVDGGVDPATLTAITFNKRAADELGERLDTAVEPLGLGRGAIRVRTFHALGREILRDDGADVSGLTDRMAVLADLFPEADAGLHARMDTAFSRAKLDLAVSADEIAADPEAGPLARSFVAYERELARRRAIDFDDLVRLALEHLTASPSLLTRWRSRCRHLLVDEVQDVDRSQLDLALLLAAPDHRIFLVGDDDQSIYGWRLADVRRLLALDHALPGLRRVDLQVNHRCPGPVVERAVRLIAHNQERFRKAIHARAGATGSLLLAPDRDDEPERTRRLIAAWPADDGTRAVLARTNRELQPAVVAALDGGLPFHAPSVELLVDDPELDRIIEDIRTSTPATAALLWRIGAVRRTMGDTSIECRRLIEAVLAWAPRHPDLDSLATAIADRRAQLAILRRDDAALSLATVHSTKGSEFDHVAVVGLDVGRFPSARAVASAEDPSRALEEERRLAYVAWTRARRTLMLSYDPDSPSPFLLEAFEPDELGLTRSINA
jgi:superfamily I DNA/RNA helicase